MKSIICAILLSACLTGIVKADGRLIEFMPKDYQLIIIEIVSEDEEEICVTVDADPTIYCFPVEEY